VLLISALGVGWSASLVPPARGMNDAGAEANR
jgi:hypothetical protein